MLSKSLSITFRYYSSTAASPQLVKQLRTITGSPLKDCMKALKEANGDIDKSKDLLKKWGLAYAERRTDRLATSGLIALKIDKKRHLATMI